MFCFTQKFPALRCEAKFSEYVYFKNNMHRLGKKTFFCKLSNFGKTDLAGKKRVKYDKFEIARKLHISNI